ncbi:MAG: cbb3-type cytochrome c oxidase subunit I [Chitinophagales bacterium]
MLNKESFVKLDKTTKFILCLELIFPIVLLLLGVYNGLLQTLYRAGIIKSTSFLGIDYYQGLTMHGVINAIVLTTFFAVAFGNATMIFHLKKQLISWVNILSVTLMTVGTGMAAWAMIVGKASVLYTFYAPLMAHPAFYLGLVLTVLGSWAAFFGWIPLIFSWRKENPNTKIPLAVWGTTANFIIWVLCSAAVAVELIFFLLPWSLGWTEGVNVELTRTLFWFFGHPLVYFWLLPAYILYYTILPKVARGKLFSDKAGRLVFALFVVLSIPVGTHHQFMEPAIEQGSKLLHAFLTLCIAIPSFLTAFTIAASLEYAGKRRGGKGLFGWMGKLPWFEKDNYLFAYAICGLLIFIIGGIGGIINAAYSMNTAVHNTGWIPGHFHLTVGGPVFLAILGLTMYMYSKIAGKKVQLPTWNLLVPYFWMLGLTFFSTGLKVGGLFLGEPRRTNMGMSYLDASGGMFEPMWLLTTLTTVLGGIIMTLAACMFFASFFKTIFSKKVNEGGIEFPVAEAYHDEPETGMTKSLWPWAIAAMIIIAATYYKPIMSTLDNTIENAPTYEPNNPMPLDTYAGDETIEVLEE